MKRGIVAIGLLAVALGVISFVMMGKIARLRADNERLTAELWEQRSLADEFARSARGPRRLGGAVSQDEKMELMRLRNEVTQLRASAEAARDAVRDALENKERGMRRVAMLEQQVASREFPKEEWTFRGFQTPEDSLVSGMWALINGDLEKVVEALSSNEREQWRARAEGKTEEEVRAGILREYGDLTGMKITEERHVSPKEVVLNVEMAGPGQMSMRELHFHLEGNEWKMQSPVNTYDPLAFYRRNPELMRRYFPHLFRGDSEQPQEEGPQQPLTPSESMRRDRSQAQQQALPPEIMRRYGLQLQQDIPARETPVDGQGTLPPEPSPEQ